MFRTIIAIAALMQCSGLCAQKADPRGIYHLVSITGRNGTEPAPYDQYKICTDSMTWMVSITETGEPNEHGVRTSSPYFNISDNDHMVFNYTGEQPDVADATKTRIYDSDKKGFTLKWWSTSPNHRIFPHNDWCIEQYKSNHFSGSGEKIFDMLYSTKSKARTGGIQGRWKVVGAVKMWGDRYIEQWQKSGRLDLDENDYVPYTGKYAIIDDRHIFTAYSEPLQEWQLSRIYGYLNKYEADAGDKLAVGDSLVVRLIPDRERYSPMTNVFYRLSDDMMIVKTQHAIIYEASLSQQNYEIWERADSKIPVIRQITATPSTYITEQPATEPRGLYRYVAGGEPCRIIEVADSIMAYGDSRQYIYREIYRLCSDTAHWDIEICDNQPKSLHNVTIGDVTHLDYQPKEIYISPTTINTHYTDAEVRNKWMLFGCTENGFGELTWSGKALIRCYDNRCITPLAEELIDVLGGRIPYDASHPLYGTWEMMGRVLSPTETKIDSVMKGLCTDYVSPFITNLRLIYALTPQHTYSVLTGRNLYLDKTYSDGKDTFITLEPYSTGTEREILHLHWTVHWIDDNTILIRRDHEDLQIFTPVCMVLKRKVGGESLVNVIHMHSPQAI